MKPKKIKNIFRQAVKEAFIELINEVDGVRKPTFLTHEKEQWKQEQLVYFEQLHKERLTHIDTKFSELGNLLDDKLSKEKLTLFYDHIRKKNFKSPDDAIDFLLVRKRWKQIDISGKKKQASKKQKGKAKKMKAELSFEGKKIKTYDLFIYPTDEN